MSLLVGAFKGVISRARDTWNSNAYLGENVPYWKSQLKNLEHAQLEQRLARRAHTPKVGDSISSLRNAKGFNGELALPS